MKLKKGASLSLAAALCAAPAVFAAPGDDAGRQEYMDHCAICHGTSAHGNGEMRRFLTTKPPDLTTLSKRNGGAFPNQLVWEMVDGRGMADAGPHGTRAMPIWGQRYRREALADPATAAAPEWHVRNRVVALLDYLSRIQEK